MVTLEMFFFRVKGPAIYNCEPGGRVEFGAMKISMAVFGIIKLVDANSVPCKYLAIHNGSLGCY